MDDFTARLGLNYLLPNQAQKHVTLNAALKQLDGLVQAVCLRSDLNTPPEAPSPGDCYIVGAAASGLWEHQDASIAIWCDDSWHFLPPKAGWRIYDTSEQDLLVFDGTDWSPHISNTALSTSDASSGVIKTLGINGEALEPNRFVVKSDAALLTHDDQTPGTGHTRLVINKAGGGHSASVVVQSEYVGHAELGLLGNRDFSIQVSPDGQTWRTGIVVDQTSGAVDFPEGLSSPKNFLGDLGLFHEFLAVADDSYILVDKEADQFGSLMLLYTNWASSGKGLIFCRAAHGPDIRSVSTDGPIGLLTGPLNGTTGPDGQINVSCDDNGKYYVENRTGSARNIWLTLFGH